MRETDPDDKQDGVPVPDEDHEGTSEPGRRREQGDDEGEEYPSHSDGTDSPEASAPESADAGLDGAAVASGREPTPNGGEDLGNTAEAGDRPSPDELKADDDGLAPTVDGAGEASATAQDVVPPEIRRTLRASLVEGSVAQVFLNWTSGSVLIGYMLHYGASSTQLGLVASVPLLAQAMSPLAAWLAAVLGRRRVLVVTNAVLARGLWLLAALLPQLGLPAGAEPTFLVLLVMLSSIFQSANGSLWASWMGDVVPDSLRGRFFGVRTGIAGLAGTLANLGAGWFLDRAGAPLGFQVVLGVGVVAAFVSVGLYLIHYDPPTPRERLSLASVFTSPLADLNFRRFLAFAVFWQFAVFISAPFVFPYFLDELGLTFTQIAVWSSIAAVTAFATATLWGRAADRVGNKSVLAIGTFVAGTLMPLSWILAGMTGHIGFIWVSAVFDAVAWGAIGPAIFNLALTSAPRGKRTVFFAMYALASGVAGFMGGVLSGPLLELLRPLADMRLLGAPLSPYYGLFVISGVLRAQAWRLLRRVQETNAWRTRDLLRQMRHGWRMSGFFWRS